MDYEIYDQVLAYTVARNDWIEFEGQPYQVIEIEDENEYGEIGFYANDSWGEPQSLTVSWDDIISLIAVVEY